MSPTEAPGRVMVVDDDPVHCELMRRWLEGDGHEVIVYTNGERSLRGLPTTTPEAICLDLGQPGMSGADTLLHILEHHPRLPVIVLTANTAVEQAVALIQSGAFNYLTKLWHDELAFLEWSASTEIAWIEDGADSLWFHEG